MDNKKIEKILKEIENVREIVDELMKDTYAIVHNNVVEWGNSAHVPTQKKYIGCPVTLIIKNKPEEKEVIKK